MFAREAESQGLARDVSAAHVRSLRSCGAEKPPPPEAGFPEATADRGMCGCEGARRSPGQGVREGRRPEHPPPHQRTWLGAWRAEWPVEGGVSRAPPRGPQARALPCPRTRTRTHGEENTKPKLLWSRVWHSCVYLCRRPHEGGPRAGAGRCRLRSPPRSSAVGGRPSSPLRAPREGHPGPGSWRSASAACPGGQVREGAEGLQA